MILKNESIYDDDDYIYDEEDDTDFTDYSDDEYSDAQIQEFAKDMHNFIQGIIDQSGLIDEDFTSGKNLSIHYGKHCISDKENRRSTRQRIYYDFTDKSQYLEYEKKISDAVRNTDYIIDSFDDYDAVMDYMRKLFEGNTVVTFSKSCGLKRDGRAVSVSFISYSSNETSNYGGGNTIDVCIKGRRNNTVTLYAVDAHDVERKLKSIIKNDLDCDLNDEPQFHFNND